MFKGYQGKVRYRGKGEPFGPRSCGARIKTFCDTSSLGIASKRIYILLHGQKSSCKNLYLLVAQLEGVDTYHSIRRWVQPQHASIAKIIKHENTNYLVENEPTHHKK